MSTAPAAAAVDPPQRPPPRPTQRKLWHRYHRDADPALEDELVQQHLPLVKTVVGRLVMTLPPHVDFNDLHSAGLVGLLQAMRNFEPHSGVPFESYARVRIRGAVFDELRRMDWVPRSIHEKARKIQNTLQRLEQKLGSTPTEMQMAEALGISLDDYLACLDEIRPATFVCLDATSQTEQGETSSLYEIVADHSQDDPTERVCRRELAELVARRIKQLPDIQRKVLALYYEEDLLLREIAEVFGLTESRICQIHAQAILAIRSYIDRYEAGAVGAQAAIAHA